MRSDTGDWVTETDETNNELTVTVDAWEPQNPVDLHMIGTGRATRCRPTA